MAYSDRLTKGRIGYTGSWPLIIIERAKSDKPLTPVLCEVFGFEQESGSVYAKDIRLADDLRAWLAALQGRTPYFKGMLHTGIDFSPIGQRPATPDQQDDKPFGHQGDFS